MGVGNEEGAWEGEKEASRKRKKSGRRGGGLKERGGTEKKGAKRSRRVATDVCFPLPICTPSYWNGLNV